jgi:hypothetical protein
MDYQPSGINFSLFEDANFTDVLEQLQLKHKKKIPKAEKREMIGHACLKNLAPFAERVVVS